MADRIKLSVVGADGVEFEKMVSYISIPTELGSVGVLYGHAPMLCAMSEGKVRCRFGADEMSVIPVSGGIAEVRGSQVTLLVRGGKK